MRISRIWVVIAAAAVVVACTGPAATTKPVTAAPVTAAPMTAEPPVTAPPATDAPATDAPATDAPATDAPATDGPSPSGLPTSIGEGEGSVTALVWPGYLEDGGTLPEYDWVTPFEEETGCLVEFTTFGTSDQAFSTFATNPTEYDVISASGDASLRLVRAGYVQPVNLDLMESYEGIFDALKNKPYNTVDGVPYGVPHGRGANQLMWRTDTIDPAPTRWDQMFAADSGYNVSVYDAPIYIADAAVILMDTNPELGITNPYALDETQFAAAIALLEQQKPTITDYWVDYVAQMDKFRNGDADVGTSWQVIANLLGIEDPPVPVAQIKPEEGSTGWSDTWMINSQTQHINCAYMLVNWVTSPEVNIQIAEWFGEAPNSQAACDLATPAAEGFEEHCDIFHANDDAFWEDVWYWQTPEAVCVDGRTDVTCKDFDEWSDAWQVLKG